MTTQVAPHAPTRRLLTVAEVLRMDEAGIFDPDERLELIEGELYVVAAMGSPHAGATFRTAQWFRAKLAQRVFVREEKPVRLSPRSLPLPDIAVVRPREDFYRSHHPLPADIYLIIEIADTSLRQDLGIKLAMYAAADIAEYWVADLRGRRLFVHRRPEGRAYRDVTVVGEGAVAPLAFSAIAISLDDIFGTTEARG